MNIYKSVIFVLSFSILIGVSNIMGAENSTNGSVSESAKIGNKKTDPVKQEEMAKFLSLFILPDRISDRTDDQIIAEYVAGMPVIISVEIVNSKAKKYRPDARPIKIEPNWQTNIQFSIFDKQGISPSISSPKLIVETLKGGHNDLPVELLQNELSGQWLISTEATTTLSGEYKVNVSWNGINARELIVLRFRKPNGKGGNASVLLGQAKEAYLLKQYEMATNFIDEARQQGKQFVDEDMSALMLEGDVLVAANRHEDALKAYEKALIIFNSQPKGPRTEPPSAILWKISQTKKAIK